MNSTTDTDGSASLSQLVTGHELYISLKAGNLCISIALNVQKYVHNRISQSVVEGNSEVRPLLRDNGILLESPAYYKDKLWWMAQVLITIGEIGNFVAYGFSSAVLVAPLGTVALISNAVIAPLFLYEPIYTLDVVGILLAIVGTVSIVAASSQTEEPMLSLDDMKHALTQPLFLGYCALSLILYIVLMNLSRREVAKRYPYIDLGLVAIFGAFTVLSTKALSSLMNSNFLTMFKHPLTYLFLFVLIVTIVLQVSYLNQALSRFNSTLVIPVNFVMFTTSSLVGSAILYRDFEHMTTPGTCLSLVGISIMFFGVYLITLPKDDVSLESGADEEELSSASPLLAFSTPLPNLILRSPTVKRRISMYIPGAYIIDISSPVISHRTASLIKNNIPTTDSDHSCSS